MDAQPSSDFEGDGAAYSAAGGVFVLPEPERLQILAEHAPDSLLDDPELKAAVEFAGKLCDAPIALVSLVEDDRQRFLARRGLEALETPRSASFCQYAMVGSGIYEVRDATADPLFAHNVLVTGEPNIRFYAGAPLVSEEGAALGALCIIDRVARPEGLNDLQREGLSVLASTVMRRLSDRRAHIARKAAREEAAESRARFDALSDAIPQMAWSTGPDGQTDYFNRRWEEFTGVKATDHYGAAWIEALHPEDRERAASVWQAAVDSGEPYEVEYRLRRHDGEYRWTLARGLPMKDERGTAVRWFGTNTDIHERRLLEERSDVLSRELSHRIKNIFSVVAGLVSLEARAFPELKSLADGVRQRITALGRAHDYVRPQGAGDSASKSLHGLLAELFGAYVEGDARRVGVSGDDLPIGAKATTPLALVFHELATNAAKYGALSNEDGRVDVSIARDGDEVVIDWREGGGPAIAEPAHVSFGTNLIDMSVTHQLRGRIERQWDGGLTARIRVPHASLD